MNKPIIITPAYFSEIEKSILESEVYKRKFESAKASIANKRDLINQSYQNKHWGIASFEMGKMIYTPAFNKQFLEDLKNSPLLKEKLDRAIHNL
jgi:hypothetical protein